MPVRTAVSPSFTITASCEGTIAKSKTNGVVTEAASFAGLKSVTPLMSRMDTVLVTTLAGGGVKLGDKVNVTVPLAPGATSPSRWRI